MPATFHFYIRKDRPDKQDLCPIYLRITHNRKKKYINTGIRVKRSEWNSDREEVRRSHRIFKKLNHELSIMKENAAQAYRELDREKRASADAIKRKLEYISKDNFFILAEEYQDEIRGNSYYTWKQNKVAIDKVRKFHGSEHLPLNLIDAEFLQKLVKFMQGKPYNNKASTIRKNFGAIGAVLDKAVLGKLIPKNPIDSPEFEFPKQRKTTSKTKLTLEQIRMLENTQQEPDSREWHARNAFLLSFYFCGMRFGDLCELKWENVKNGRLVYDMNKTGNPISIPIKEGAKKILGHYRGKDNNGYVFPFLADLSEKEQNDHELVRRRISSWNAYVNGQDSSGKLTGLKALAKDLKIEEDVSMHVARHSFAQYAVNDKEIPPYKIMMLLGHKSVKTTMQYLKSLDLKTVDTVMDEIF